MLFACGCSSQDCAPAFGTLTYPIIEGTLDSGASGIVNVRHTESSVRCSGTAIAPNRVVTAAHCVLRNDVPLTASGFHVGFGPDEEHFIERQVSSVEWTDPADGGTVSTLVERGEDVALLHLNDPAPSGTRFVDVDLDYTPAASDTLSILGYGVSSLSTGAQGVRLSATVTPSGFDPVTGVLQMTGPSACFGDSGGPVLLEPGGKLVGVIGEVGGSGDASFCDVGLTFAATIANPRVRDLLRRACDAAGGCGPREPHDAATPREASTYRDAKQPGDAQPDARAPEEPHHDADVVSRDSGPSSVDAAEAPARIRKASNRDGGCTVAARTKHVSFGSALLAFAALVLRRRRRAVTLLAAVTLLGCTDDGAGRLSGNAPTDAGADARPLSRDASGTGGKSSTDAAIPPSSIGGRDGSHPDAFSPETGTPSDRRDAAGGAPPVPTDPDAAPPVSKYCGDRIRDPVLEECDDGPGDEDDACTSDCRARDAFATEPRRSADAGPLSNVGRRMGSGPHVVAAGAAGIAVVFQESDPSPSVWLQGFDSVGHRRGSPIRVSEGRSPTGAANPVVAALPSGAYAVAWTDGTNGTPDVVMRVVDAARGSMGAVVLAHDGDSGSQQDPDIVCIGEEVVVGWTDLFNVHVRRFSAGLGALGAEEPFAAGPGLHGSVSLGEHDGSWALAWRANESGLDSIRVVAGEHAWSTEPEVPGRAGDRPALATLKDGRLLAMFSAGLGSSDAAVPAMGLRAALVDPASPGGVTSEAVPTGTSTATRPRLVSVAQQILLAWQSEPTSGPSRAQISEVHGTWDGAGTVTLMPDNSLPIAASTGDLSNPGLARVGRDGVVGVWEDASFIAGRPSPDLAYVLRGVPFIHLDGT